MSRAPAAVLAVRAAAGRGAQAGAAGLAALATGWLALRIPPPALLLGMGGAAFSILLAARPDVGVLGLLALRSSLDVFTETRVPISDLVYVNLSGALSVLLTMVAGAYVAMGRIGLGRSGVERAYLTFLAYWLAAAPLSADPLASVQEWFRVCAPFALYLLTSRLVVGAGRARLVRTALLLSAAAPLAAGCLQLLTGAGLLRDDPHPEHLLAGTSHAPFARVPGTFVLPMAFAFYLVTLFPLALVDFQEARRGRGRVLRGSILALMVFFLAATYTRGAWVAFLAALAVLGLLRSRAILAGVALLAAVTILRPALLGPLHQRWMDILDPALYPTSTVATRLDLWGTALGTLFPESPILGHGLGTFPLVYGSVRWFEAAHSDYVRLLVEGGIVGLALYVWVLAALVASAWRARREAPDAAARAASAALLAVLAAHLVAHAGDNVFGMPVVQFYLWGLAALAGAGSAPAARAPAPGAPP